MREAEAIVVGILLGGTFVVLLILFAKYFVEYGRSLKRRRGEN